MPSCQAGHGQKSSSLAPQSSMAPLFPLANGNSPDVSSSSRPPQSFSAEDEELEDENEGDQGREESGSSVDGQF